MTTQRSECDLPAFNGCGFSARETLCFHYSVIHADYPTYSFFTEALRIAAEEYVPSTEDIRHTAEPERGIMETYFNTDRSSIQPLSLTRVLQVYGYKTRKWIHLFEGVTSIIFYVSLSDYDKWVVGSDERVCILRLLTTFVTIRS